MTLATILVLLIIGVELYRPILIGNAIDEYINGYYRPYVVSNASASDAVLWNNIYLSRESVDTASGSSDFYQIFLLDNRYYMAEHLTKDECTALQEADTAALETYVKNGAVKLSKPDLKILRANDFKGILRAGVLFLLLLWIFPQYGRHLASAAHGAANCIQTA